METTAEEQLKTEGLRVGMHLEIMDTQCVRRTRIATIEKLTGGGRISVKYFVRAKRFLYKFKQLRNRSKRIRRVSKIVFFSITIHQTQKIWFCLGVY